MALVLLISLMSVLLTTCGLNLTTPSSEYQVELGQDISLRCHFTLDPVDFGSLEIEWTVDRSHGRVEGEHLICYIEDVVHHFLGFEHRLYFSYPDPQDGDASLTITRVKIIDNGGTYHCKVTKGWEIQSRQIKLMVMEEVSVPVHGSNGGTESDVDLKLRNRSSSVTTFPETSASTQDDLSSQGNAKNTTGTTTGTASVITTETITGTTSVIATGTLTGTTTEITTGTITGTYRDFGMVHDIEEIPTVDLSLTTESQNTSSQDRGVSIGVAATITFIVIISAGTIFCCWKQKRQQKSEENVSADEAKCVPTQSERTVIVDIAENTWNLWENMGIELEDITKTLMDIKEEGSTEEVPETQNVDFEDEKVMGTLPPEVTSL